MSSNQADSDSVGQSSSPDVAAWCALFNWIVTQWALDDLCGPWGKVEQPE